MCEAQVPVPSLKGPEPNSFKFIQKVFSAGYLEGERSQFFYREATRGFTIYKLILANLNDNKIGMAKKSNFLKLVIDTAKESYKSEEYRAR